MGRNRRIAPRPPPWTRRRARAGGEESGHVGEAGSAGWKVCMRMVPVVSWGCKTNPEAGEFQAQHHSTAAAAGRHLHSGASRRDGGGRSGGGCGAELAPATLRRLREASTRLRPRRGATLASP